MKKKSVITLLVVATMSMVLVACGGNTDKSNKDTPSTETEQTTTDTETDDGESEADANVGQPAEPVEEETGAEEMPTVDVESEEALEEELEEEMEVYVMSEEMTNIHNAAITSVGIDNYWANMQMNKTMFEEMIGLTSDMYTDFLYEMPMVSANVDSLLVVKPADGQTDAVLEKIKEFRQSKVDDTFQYPQNTAKTKASIVETVGDYIVYIQLGGEAGIITDDEAVALTACETANTVALNAIKAYVVYGVIPEAPAE